MLQQWLLLAMLAPTSPSAPCPDVAHVPAADVAHTPEADLDPWLDPATADLIVDPKPRIERPVGNDGARVDIDIPPALVDGKDVRCRQSLP